MAKIEPKDGPIHVPVLMEEEEQLAEPAPSIPVDPSRPFSSAESEFQATPEMSEQAFRQSRPNREGKKLGADRDTPVPSPPRRSYKSDATHPQQRSKAAFTWWNALPEWAKDKIEAYVYRDHPVLLEPPLDIEGKPEWYSYIDKIIGNEPLQDDNDLLNRYGCGNYRIVLNEVRPKGVKTKDDRTILTIWVVNVGSGNYRSNPPADKHVSDVAKVDLNHPGNAGYVAYLRGVNQLPDQKEIARREDEMATATIVEKAMDTVVTMAKEARQAPPAPAPAPGDAKALDVVADAAKRSNEIMQNTFTQAQGMLAAAKAEMDGTAGTRADPFALALQIVGILDKRSSSSDAELNALRSQIATLQAEQMKMLTDQVKTLIDAKTVQPNSPFGGVTEGLRALKEFKGTYEELIGGPMGGGGEDEKNPVEEAASAMAPKFMRQYGPLINLGLSVVDKFLTSRIQAQAQSQMPYYPPQAYQPQPHPSQPQFQPQPQSQQPQQFGNRPQGQGPIPVPPPASPYPVIELSPEIQGLLSAVAVPLFSHLNIEKDGGEFADYFVFKFGQSTYEQVAAMGAETVLSALYSFPQTAGPLQRFHPEMVKKFIEDFCTTQFEEEDEDGAGKATDKTPA